MCFAELLTGASDCGDYEYQADFNWEIITSPGYPNDYGNYLSCIWTIKSGSFCSRPKTVELIVTDYDLEDRYDHLVINNGKKNTNLTGSAPLGHPAITGKKFRIRLKTDRSNVGKGFKLKYRCGGSFFLCY